MKKLINKSNAPKYDKILFFLKYYFKNFPNFSIFPKNILRIFHYNYWYTLINYTYIRANYYKSYAKENWHKINENNSFNYNHWKWNLFDKRKNLQLSYLTDYINLKKEKEVSILEVGCGAGEVGAKLILSINPKIKIKYVGIDFSTSETNKGKKAFKKLFLKKNIKWSFIGKNFLLFDKNNKIKFDYLICVSVLEMIQNKDIDKFIKKMCKKTRNAIFLNENFDKFPHSHARSHKELNQYFSKYGFDLKKYSYKIEKYYRTKNKSFEFEKLLLFFKRRSLRV
jgi:cyclopropane fatty-acyl-phospholipid synthase-like methyltransferase